ncbi:MAG: HDIG domain-containing protein [Thermoplasmata archaeon]|nr:HDIG domain-containing protein [Thermoplasmata archaeon]
MLNREQALNLLKQYIKRENLFKHCIAVEAILGELADQLGEEKDKWKLCGLLHDIDFEITEQNPEKHALVAVEILQDKLPDEILHAIKSHNFENTGSEPKNKLDYALIAADAVSGLVIAAALIMPSKKLADIKIETLKRKFKDKSFARRCSRERISMCEKIEVDLDMFLKLSLKALQNISTELGL